MLPLTIKGRNRVDSRDSRPCLPVDTIDMLKCWTGAGRGKSKGEHVAANSILLCNTNSILLCNTKEEEIEQRQQHGVSRFWFHCVVVVAVENQPVPHSPQDFRQ